MTRQAVARLDRMLTFQKRGTGNDGYGNRRTEYEAQFDEPAALAWRRGGEVQLAARMQARQPVILTVRRNARTMTIRPHWRAVWGDQKFDIREQPTIAADRRYLEMLAEAMPLNG
ncbi:head-tail adaptor protein [Palleronia caenipelagi]|uniref:Head-tail adaptor protein n=1 Tax=Palleronia caenipelagi TaxID=2489174 RepID=A0A547Q693_9RHOB|nr:head-tail adaptor protein [Palleronia caenipelagi]TRD21907.1 head-tail adaptor protein [Palleronia caenipelagi]